MTPRRRRLRRFPRIAVVAIGAILACIAATSALSGGPAAVDPPTDFHPPLTWRGGEVLHRDVTHVVAWAPGGRGDPRAYAAGVGRFLADVSRDPAGAGVYGVVAEYGDGRGSRPYESRYGGATTDRAPLPLSGCRHHTRTTTCLTEQQVERELAAFVRRSGAPTRRRDVYFVLLPARVTVCLSGGGCSPRAFCGYHGETTSRPHLLYAVIPHLGSGRCTQDDRGRDRRGDTTSSVVSHEHIEVITDPSGGGWLDRAEEEIGDICLFRYGDAEEDERGPYNQVINGRRYWVQEEWSNAYRGCVQRSDAPLGVTVVARRIGKMRYELSASSAVPDGRYSWHFGDGRGGRGARVVHRFVRGGRLAVQATVLTPAGGRGTGIHWLRVR